MVTLPGKRCCHPPSIAAMRHRVSQRPGQEPQRGLVMRRELGGVDRVLNQRERRALLDHALDLLGGPVEGE
jgi:hypothetical protein